MIRFSWGWVVVIFLAALPCAAMAQETNAPAAEAQLEPVPSFTYTEPDLSQPLFNDSLLPLSAEEKEALAGTLAQIIRSRGDISHEWYPRAMGLALQLHPESRLALIATPLLKKGQRPSAAADAPDAATLCTQTLEPVKKIAGIRCGAQS